MVASNDQKGKRSASHENDDIVTNDAPSAHVVPASAESTVITRQQEAEKKMVDWEKFACLLCKRQLQSKDLLQKHLEMSDLHLACVLGFSFGPIDDEMIFTAAQLGCSSSTNTDRRRNRRIGSARERFKVSRPGQGKEKEIR